MVCDIGGMPPEAGAGGVCQSRRLFHWQGVPQSRGACLVICGRRRKESAIWSSEHGLAGSVDAASWSYYLDAACQGQGFGKKPPCLQFTF